ncbi:hypothetical protein [Limosilactobacillus reuteri]|uniref:hypothetical protein n=1 Tax=Limosilactobacillus reuteri TaxID=1598 RepID=UPI000A2E78BA|nr:hypothetical protein [Limosilactobacillus reuteri]OTA47917.1 hypothetical protein BHL90_09890 [Limosilactobacillus reuteri]OTA54862.1 hypothetical protein BHL91_09920 [Limosilactobacillus reuteri]OTA66407.1 hypothetical protein BHL92_09825 [Limosilactobacillus reuteri]
MARDIPQVSVLYDIEERFRQCEPMSDNSLMLSVDGVKYDIPYDEIDCLSDDEIELVKDMNTKDKQAVELVRTTDEPLPFLSDYNRDLALKGCEFDWSGNVWSKTGRLRATAHGGNGYLQIDNAGIHRRLYAEFLERANGQKYAIERILFNASDYYQVHHMTGNHNALSDNCLTNLKLVDMRKHSLYTSLINEIKREIRAREKVGVLI